VARGVDDGEDGLGRLELPQSDIDGDTALALSLQLVQHPDVLERSLASSRVGPLYHGVFADFSSMTPTPVRVAVASSVAIVMRTTAAQSDCPAATVLSAIRHLFMPISALVGDFFDDQSGTPSD
jgi:hypothetical protein